MSDLKWFHAESDQAEEWEGPFDSRDACVADALARCEGPWWIAQGAPTTDAVLDVLDVDWLVEELNSRIATEEEIGGCDHEDRVEPKASGRDEANRAFRAWAQQYLDIREWWQIIERTKEQVIA